MTDQLSARIGFHRHDGVGTRLITSAGDSALDGVYKLVAVQKNGDWLPAMKISENPEKVTNPGHKKAWRIYDTRERATADLIGLADEVPDTWDGVFLHHPSKPQTYRSIDKADVSRIEPLHIQVMREGKLIYDMPTIQHMREVREKDIALLDPGVRRIMNPHIYHVSLTEKLWELKQNIIQSMRV